MGKLLFKNAGLVVRATEKGLKVAIISKFAGESRTYYITATDNFNSNTDFESMWNEFSYTWQALIHAVENRGVNIYREVSNA